MSRFSPRFLIAFLAATALAADTARAQFVPSKLSLHGYLTQGFGISGRDTVMGLTPRGTADYRRAAIVARYAATTRDFFVVQVANRRLGDSPTMQFEDEIKIDMAFFEHRFDNGTRVRVGKALMPFGIYNEVRFAGTLMPFYRAPISVYWEGTWTNENIDGVMLSRQFRAGQSWELSTDLFAGEYRLVEFGPVQASPTSYPQYKGGVIEAKNLLGAQLWLTTPVEGLRFGANARRHTDLGGVYARGTGVETKEYNASVDGSFEHFSARSEMLVSRSLGSRLLSRYVQIGFKPIDRLSLNVQSEAGDVRTPPSAGPSQIIKLVRDNAVSANVFFTTAMVLKLEAHATRGFNIEQLMDLRGAPVNGSYFILSLSTSF